MHASGYALYGVLVWIWREFRGRKLYLYCLFFVFLDENRYIELICGKFSWNCIHLLKFDKPNILLIRNAIYILSLMLKSFQHIINLEVKFYSKTLLSSELMILFMLILNISFFFIFFMTLLILFLTFSHIPKITVTCQIFWL